MWTLLWQVVHCDDRRSWIEWNAFISYRYAHDSRTNMKKNKIKNKIKLKKRQEKIAKKRH